MPRIGPGGTTPLPPSNPVSSVESVDSADFRRRVSPSNAIYPFGTPSDAVETQGSIPLPSAGLTLPATMPFSAPEKIRAEEAKMTLVNLRRLAKTSNAVSPPRTGLTTPALAASGRAGGIEAHMLESGLKLIRDAIGQNASEAMKDLDRAILDANDCMAYTNAHKAEKDQAVSAANARIQENLAELFEKITIPNATKALARACIHQALRKKPWKQGPDGAYRVATRHPLDRVLVEPGMGWLQAKERVTFANRAMDPSNIADGDLIGTLLPRLILRQIGDELHDLRLEGTDAIRLRISSAPSEAGVTPLSDAEANSESSADRAQRMNAFRQLLHDAGAAEKVISDLHADASLTAGDARSAIESTVGKPAYPKFDTNHFPVGLRAERGLASGSFGSTWKASVRRGEERTFLTVKFANEDGDLASPIGFKEINESTFPRGKGADTAYLGSSKHIVIPSAFVVMEKQANPDGMRASLKYRVIPRKQLHAYLDEERYKHLTDDKDHTLKFVGNIQPFINGPTLGKLNEIKIEDKSILRNELIKQGIQIMSELDRYGFAHGDIKPANLMLDANNNLLLIDTEDILKFHAGGRQKQLPAMRTAAFSIPLNAWVHSDSNRSLAEGEEIRMIAKAQDYFGVAVSLLESEISAFSAEHATTLTTGVDALYTKASEVPLGSESLAEVVNFSTSLRTMFEAISSERVRWSQEHDEDAHALQEARDRLQFLSEIAISAVEVTVDDRDPDRVRLRPTHDMGKVVEALLREERYAKFAPT